MKRPDPQPSLRARLLSLAATATELAAEVEQLEQAAVAGGEASRTLEQLRATLGLAPAIAAPIATTSPATSRPRRAHAAAASSDAGTSPPSVPTHCGAPGCGKPLVQSGAGRKRYYCDRACGQRAARAARTSAAATTGGDVAPPQVDVAEDEPDAPAPSWVAAELTREERRRLILAAAEARTA